jgi:hypothetical protein
MKIRYNAIENILCIIFFVLLTIWIDNRAAGKTYATAGEKFRTGPLGDGLYYVLATVPGFARVQL